MAFVAVGVLASAALLAVIGIWLVFRSGRRERAALAALADRRGWSHTAKPGAPLAEIAARVLPRDAPPVLRDALAGPTAVGPFAIARAALPASGGHGRREISVLHVRTPLASPGLQVRPAEVFRPDGRDGFTATLGHEGFGRIYEVSTVDRRFAQDALDWDTCALLAAPERPVRIDWIDHDLVIAFPLAARTPRGVESLVAWGARVAGRLNEAHPLRASARPATRPTRAPVPAGVDPLIP